jgi:hypothetical protein
MRTSTREKSVRAQRKELEAKRSAISRLRKEKRKGKGRAEEIAKAIKRSPAGKRATAILKTKRGIARKQEQANYQKTRSRAGTRMEGRRKQIQGELRGRLEE